MMKREMTLTIQHPTDYNRTLGKLTRSFDNEQASGNFAVCRVRVGGKRFNRISCESDLLVYPAHPAETDGVLFYDACVAELARLEDAAYKAYTTACNRESLNGHTLAMWKVHGKPTGPI